MCVCVCMYMHIYIYTYTVYCTYTAYERKGGNVHLQNSTYPTFFRHTVHYEVHAKLRQTLIFAGLNRPTISIGSMPKLRQRCETASDRWRPEIDPKFTSLHSAATVYGQSGPLFHFKLPEQWDFSETG